MPSATGLQKTKKNAANAADASDVVAMAAQLRLSATRLARLLRQQSDTGLSPSQLSALSAIHILGPVTLGALAEYERVAPPTITKAVTKLEADGLVERTTDPEDRRVARVATTKAGEAVLARIRQRKNVWLATRLAGLDPDDRARLGAALDVLDALTKVEP